MEDQNKKNQEPEENLQNIASNKYLWIIGAVILIVAGWFGIKTLLGSFEGYKLTLIDAPKEVSTGSVATFTWRIDGPPTTIGYTAVHLGTISNPGELGKEVKPGDTKYPDFVKDFTTGKYDVPLQFVGNIRMDNPGKYYFRVYATIKDKNYWTDEYTLEVKPTDYKISIFNYLKEVIAGNVATFTWRVDGPPTTINHTSMRFGTVSTPGTLGKEVKPSQTKYKDLIRDFTNGKYDIPLQFVGNVKIATAGAYFFRGYASINGQNYWTEEYTFEAK